MNFSEFRTLLQNNVQQMVSGQNTLFVVDVDKDAMWELYLDSFPAGTNEVYRQRREFDCSCCRHFIKQFGNVVAIKDNQTVSIWDFDPQDTTYTPVVDELAAFIHGALVDNVAALSEFTFGTHHNFEMNESGVKEWHHFHIEIPKRFVNCKRGEEAAVQAKHRDVRNVFQRSLEELSPIAVQDVLDMVDENILYRGEEWKPALLQFATLQREYQQLKSENERNNYCWIKATQVGGSVTKIRNHSIGVLLQDLSNRVDAETAIRRYEVVVAPTNYRRPKPVFTAKMVEQAEKTVTELGLLDSLPRRFAHLSDITVNNVLWVNRDARKHMAGATSVFQAMKEDVVVNPQSVKNVPSIGIDELLVRLEQVADIQVLMENRLSGNLVSLIAPVNGDAPSVFKWGNSFSWAYNGNIADSMKEQVKAAGGNVTGILRFSIRWNDREQYNQNDYDAHCYEPNGGHIYFGLKRSQRSDGQLDVDIIHPQRGNPAVENITWNKNVPVGQYKFTVHCYNHRGGTDGFDAEIEFAGDVHSYSYRKNIPNGSSVTVATVYWNGTQFKFIEELEHTESTYQQNIWNIKTNQWQPVSTVLYSPNHWDNNAVGNRHYFFMIAGCQNDDQPNGFFNEYLPEALTPHRKVFEALGKRMKVEPSKDQLSGLGFSSTKRENAIFKIDGKLFRVVF